MNKKTRAKRPKRAKKSARSRRARPLRIIDEELPKAGRPTKYIAEYAHIAETMVRSGATEFEVAQALGVSQRTLITWKAQNPEFLQGIKDGKEQQKARVERALFHRAVGYKTEAVKIVTLGSRIARVPYDEHYPPDTGAICFYLKNADPAAYKDRHELTASIHDKPRTEIDMSDEELLEGIRREEAAKAAAAKK